MQHGMLRLPAQAITVAVLATVIAGCRQSPIADDVGGDAARAPETVAAPPATEADQAALPPLPDHEGDAPGAAVSETRPDPPRWLERARTDQLAIADTISAVHDFQFTDRLPDSGITFRGHATPDGSIDFKPNHYDHGNGLAVADVDGDGLLDMYFVSQFGQNELYRNVGGGRFEKIADAGVDFAGRVGVTASFGDIDNDGDPDLFATSVRFGNGLFENDGTGHFTEITDAAGVAYFGHSSGAVMFDYDHDGLVDIFLTNVGKYTTDQQADSPIDLVHPEGSDTNTYYVGTTDAFMGHLDPARSERNIMYHNEGGNRFADVTVQLGLVDEGWGGDAMPIDANEDGWTDLYVPNMQGHDHYYENQGGTAFVDKSLEVFPNTPWGAMGVSALDYDNDGHQDLWVTDMHSDMSVNTPRAQDKAKANVPEELSRGDSRSIWGNAFYQHGADGAFAEVSDAIGAENYWPWGLSVGDLNADGFEDAFIASSMNFNFRYAPNAVMLNDGGERFVDSEFIVGVEPRRDGLAYQPWFSLDCSGANWKHQLCIDGRLSGTVPVWEPKGTRSSAIFDLDDDGDLDIVTNEWNGEPQVLISDLADAHPVNHVSIRLTGTRSNRDGRGAVVTVEAGDDRYVRVNDGKSGYLSQSVLPVYVGLGEHAAADRITVRWPTGAEQVIEGPLSGSIEVVEGGA